MSRTVGELADKAILKNVWRKRLRTGLRKMPLKEFQLGHDPLEYLAFDWELDSTVESLVEQLENRQYRAGPPEIIRAAKSVGLTRPLAFLQPRDLIVYIALIQLVENQLLQSMSPWVRFGRSQQTHDETATAAESGWFRLWLRRQDQIWVITSTHEWLVESDVANFFASLHIDSLVHHVNNNGNLDQELINLFDHLLRQFAPVRNFRPSRTGGLPQENFDGSRIVAHTFLRDLDHEFKQEGEANKYSRWVDDIVVGADTWPEALQVVRRIQEALERLDLYPNSAKTRIIRRVDFANEYMKGENDYIGEVSDQIDEHGAPRNPKRLRERIQRHARTKDRRKAWERVLRRYYSLSKRIGEDALLSWWTRHLQEAPGSAPHIFDYLATFRVTPAKLRKLREVVDEFGSTYEDIDLLAREYVLMAPNRDYDALRQGLAKWGWGTVGQCLHSWPRLAASALVMIAKFGSKTDFDSMEKLFREEMHADSVARQQAAIILYSLGKLSDEELMEMLHDASAATSQHVRFLRALASGNKGATNRALSLLQPVERWHPIRQFVRPRPLLLAPLIARQDAAKWGRLHAQWMKNLAKNPPRLRDAATVRWLTGDPATIVS